jgi:hypothetical protein
MPEAADLLGRLLDEGLLTRAGGEARTTRRWQAAMARAALRLQREGAPWQDLRLPIACALVELLGECSDEELVGCVELLLPIEQRELGPAFAGGL